MSFKIFIVLAVLLIIIGLILLIWSFKIEPNLRKSSITQYKMLSFRVCESPMQQIFT